MKSALHRVALARDLPGEWDSLAGSCFQRREFLRHAERYNPCAQRYWLLVRDGRLAAGAVVYTLPLDLLTFAGIPSPIRMQIVGLPVSVSAPGLVGDAASTAELVGRLRIAEAGLLVGLNLDAPARVEGLQQGRTLPTVVLRRRFDSFDHYLASLNSAHRRRLRRSMEPFAEVRAETGPCSRFDDAAHALYLAVFERSDAKLERLDAAFFRHLPPWFTFTTYRHRGQLVGWHICARDERLLPEPPPSVPGGRSPPFFFFLGGLDYARNEELNTYFNLLLGVLKEGIAAGAWAVDFGQTAEVPKTRLGGELVEKHLFAWHANALVRRLIGLGKGALEYRTRVPPAHVFRSQEAA